MRLQGAPTAAAPRPPRLSRCRRSRRGAPPARPPAAPRRPLWRLRAGERRARQPPPVSWVAQAGRVNDPQLSASLPFKPPHLRSSGQRQTQGCAGAGARSLRWGAQGGSARCQQRLQMPPTPKMAAHAGTPPTCKCGVVKGGGGPGLEQRKAEQHRCIDGRSAGAAVARQALRGRSQGGSASSSGRWEARWTASRASASALQRRLP